jgi:hypothetical protein
MFSCDFLLSCGRFENGCEVWRIILGHRDADRWLDPKSFLFFRKSFANLVMLCKKYLKR